MLEKPRLVIEVGESSPEQTKDPSPRLPFFRAVDQATVERQIVKVALNAPGMNLGNSGQGVGGVLLSAGEERLTDVLQTELHARSARLFDQVLDQAYFRGISGAWRHAGAGRSLGSARWSHARTGR